MFFIVKRQTPVVSLEKIQLNNYDWTVYGA